jgi:hypothetical protein
MFENRIMGIIFGSREDEMTSNLSNSVIRTVIIHHIEDNMMGGACTQEIRNE